MLPWSRVKKLQLFCAVFNFFGAPSAGVQLLIHVPSLYKLYKGLARVQWTPNYTNGTIFSHLRSKTYAKPFACEELIVGRNFRAMDLIWAMNLRETKFWKIRGIHCSAALQSSAAFEHDYRGCQEQNSNIRC